jgi:hypothetical protein
MQHSFKTQVVDVHTRIAYRPLDGNEYSVLWPQGAANFNVR